MKKMVFFLLTLSVCISAMAYDKYWIIFKDKNGTPFTVNNPSAFLSQRAIQRRINQNISITQNDLPVTPIYVQLVLATGNVNLRYTSRWFNAISIQTTDANALATISTLPFVQSVQPVMRYKRPNDDYTETFNNFSNAKQASPSKNKELLAYNYGPSFNQINMIGGDCMHFMGYSGEGMVVAVLDAGFYKVDSLPVFDSLWANQQILGTRDFVTGDTMVFEDHWHGTMVLSCMGGYLSGQIVGTSPKASFWLLRTEDADTEFLVEEDNWVAGAEFADSVGADILNTSLGYTTFDDNSMNHSYQDLDGNTCRISVASDFAVSKGMFAVCSAGNSGASVWYHIGAPADADSALTVGAVDAGGVITNFSSRGPSADGDIKPNVCAQGRDAIVSSMGGGIQTANGTSFSSPITCGAVACLWQANPTMTNMEIYDAIIKSAHKYNFPDDSLYGYGIPDFCMANIILSQSEKINTVKNTQVYPNPFNQSFSFVLESATNQMVILELKDISGKKVYSAFYHMSENSVNTIEVGNLSHLDRGIYMLTVIGDELFYSKKLVKE
ncbi:MAG: S8 family serine peptidase [Bacteroidetes bacterium]|nr:T9SS C-terminal target domain-containing protein [Bacteroidota bacterium]MBV6460103.1 hypothetical protein [Flavobacteriales bacterium]WKZ73974.1 MAG: S8 family serine peptidase [Vicingaceae bacterium]MCL4816453.1 S8 family serine peptidase [Flavobacteriales bacterium]NOG95527.1 S8 family serine peptidase [Bacteroidota bacterium]